MTTSSSERMYQCRSGLCCLRAESQAHQLPACCARALPDMSRTSGPRWDIAPAAPGRGMWPRRRAPCGAARRAARRGRSAGWQACCPCRACTPAGAAAQAARPAAPAPRRAPRAAGAAAPFASPRHARTGPAAAARVCSASLSARAAQPGRGKRAPAGRACRTARTAGVSRVAQRAQRRHNMRAWRAAASSVCNARAAANGRLHLHRAATIQRWRQSLTGSRRGAAARTVRDAAEDGAA